MACLTQLQRKFAASAFVAALAVSAVVPVSASSYSDVSDRYKEAVNYLEAQKITQGLTATSFGTGNSIKRADAAILLAKAMQLDIEQAPESKFTDVPHRAKKYVDALKAKGIVNGKTIETFASDQLITRGEAALMLAEAYGLDAGTTSNTFTDVSSKYKEAVNALLKSKITSGKTTKLFGVEQVLTRGEFAIFLHKLSTVHMQKNQLSVASEAELKAALSNDEIDKIVFTKNITAKMLPVLDRNVRIDLNGKVLTGNLVYKNYSDAETFQLTSTAPGGVLQGDLTVDVPKSDFVIDKNVKVIGKTTISNVKENTFYNHGILSAVDILDTDGVSFVNQEKGNVTETIAVNTTGNVKLSGNLNRVIINQAAKVTVLAQSDIANIVVTVNDVVLNAPSSTVKTVQAAEGIIVKDSLGKVVKTIPVIPIDTPDIDSNTQSALVKSINAKLKIHEPRLEALVLNAIKLEKLMELDCVLSNQGLSIGVLFKGADYDRNLSVSEGEFAAYIGNLPSNTFTGDSANAKAFNVLQSIYGNKEKMDSVVKEINISIQKLNLTNSVVYLNWDGVPLQKLVVLNETLKPNGLRLNELFTAADHDKDKKVDAGEFSAYVGSLPPNTIIGGPAEMKVFKALQDILGDGLENTIYTINAKFNLQGLNMDTLVFNKVSYEKLKNLNELLPFRSTNLKNLLADADLDKSGEISEAEFASFIRSLTPDKTLGDSVEAKIIRALREIYK